MTPTLLGQLALGWLALSGCVAAVVALFMAAAHRRERQLPQTPPAMRAWIWGEPSPSTQRRSGRLGREQGLPTSAAPRRLTVGRRNARRLGA